MRGALLFAGLMVTGTALRAAEPESEPVDAAFLEYLGTLEADGDNWTLLSEAGDKPAETSDQSAQAKDQSKDSKADQASKPDTKPAKPAGEMR